MKELLVITSGNEMVKTWNGELRQSKVPSAIELITEINKPFQVLRFQNARLTRKNFSHNCDFRS